MSSIRSTRFAALTVVGLLTSPLPVVAQASFQSLGDFAGGDFESGAIGISPDGLVVVGLGETSIHNHFNLERHLYSRENFKLNRNTALAEWCQLAA